MLGQCWDGSLLRPAQLNSKFVLGRSLCEQQHTRELIRFGLEAIGDGTFQREIQHRTVRVESLESTERRR
jgi:hypothetical protein